jgi:hypothetical protein
MEASGEPYPFVVRDKSDGAFTLEADVLTLSVGEKVALCYDFGPAVAQGAGQHAAWRVYQAVGTTIGVAPVAAGKTPARTYRLDADDATVSVTADPVAHRRDAGANSFTVRVAWRDGTNERGVRLVADAVGE